MTSRYKDFQWSLFVHFMETSFANHESSSRVAMIVGLRKMGSNSTFELTIRVKIIMNLR